MSEIFNKKMLPYAQKASKVLNIPVSVILAQWTTESRRGTSPLAQKNNFGGIKWSKYSKTANGTSGSFATYPSIDAFVTDYIRVLSLPYYDKVRSAVSVSDSVKALGLSPYDAGHYGGAGENIANIIKINGLTKYDGIAGTKVASIPTTTKPATTPTVKKKVAQTKTK